VSVLPAEPGGSGTGAGASRGSAMGTHPQVLTHLKNCAVMVCLGGAIWGLVARAQVPFHEVVDVGRSPPAASAAAPESIDWARSPAGTSTRSYGTRERCRTCERFPRAPKARPMASTIEATSSASRATRTSLPTLGPFSGRTAPYRTSAASRLINRVGRRASTVPAPSSAGRSRRWWTRMASPTTFRGAHS